VDVPVSLAHLTNGYPLTPIFLEIGRSKIWVLWAAYEG
jgi:hypothetical protein